MFTAKMCQAISGNTSYDSCTHRLPNGIPKEKISKVCLKMFSIRFQHFDKNLGISLYSATGYLMQKTLEYIAF